MQIESGNERFVHHILIYGCARDSNVTAYVDRSLPCYDGREEFMDMCRDMLIAWAVGGEVSLIDLYWLNSTLQ